jgi:hypothetical protein
VLRRVRPRYSVTFTPEICGQSSGDPCTDKGPHPERVSVLVDAQSVQDETVQIAPSGNTLNRRVRSHRRHEWVFAARTAGSAWHSHPMLLSCANPPTCPGHHRINPFRKARPPQDH